MKNTVWVFLCIMITLSGCKTQPPSPALEDLAVTGHLELQYAEQFTADYLAGGYALVSIADNQKFLLVPEGEEPPANLEPGVTVLRQPVTDIYLAATSAMCLFDALDALDAIGMSGTKADGWYIENARKAMEDGTIVYAGKYSAPDYELLTARGCGLAVESTMINHAPEVKEKLTDLGVPVLVEQSSYEPHPLGRTEWIKLYGLLLGKEQIAAERFREQTAYLDGIPAQSTGKSAAFFYINTSGNAVVRKDGDYVTKMIELAGGQPAFTGFGDGESASGSVNMSMERFYEQAKEADYIFYNSLFDGEVRSLQELLAKSPVLADLKAVQNGNVWLVNKDLFQEMTQTGAMIEDMHQIFTGEADNLDTLNFLYRLR